MRAASAGAVTRYCPVAVGVCTHQESTGIRASLTDRHLPSLRRIQGDLSDGGEIGVLEERAHADIDRAARNHGLFVGERIDDDAGGLRERFGEVGFFAREDEVTSARASAEPGAIAVPDARHESPSGRSRARARSLGFERAEIAKRIAGGVSTAVSSAASVPAGSPMSVASPGMLVSSPSKTDVSLAAGRRAALDQVQPGR